MECNEGRTDVLVKLMAQAGITFIRKYPHLKVLFGGKFSQGSG